MTESTVAVSHYDEDSGIDYELIPKGDGSYLLSMNGQFHLPITAEEAAVLTEEWNVDDGLCRAYSEYEGMDYLKPVEHEGNHGDVHLRA